MLQYRLFLAAGAAAALLFGLLLTRLVTGLGTSQKPTPLGVHEIPTFQALVACDAHFSHEILRIKNGLPAHNTARDLPVLHRNYRRLHRLLRQVGRRDGIPPEEQTARLKHEINRLHAMAGTTGAAPPNAATRDTKCRQMAVLPIARKRHSQLIVGK